jgi:hypothetical protein
MFSHNVTFYEKTQIWLSSTKFSYCGSIILNLIQTFTGYPIFNLFFINYFGLIQKLGNIFQLKPHHKFWEMSELDLVLWIHSMKIWSTLTLWYVIGSCRNEETIDNENAFNLEEKHYDIPAMYSLLKLVNKSINIIMAFFMLVLVLRMASERCNDRRK